MKIAAALSNHGIRDPFISDNFSTRKVRNGSWLTALLVNRRSNNSKIVSMPAIKVQHAKPLVRNRTEMCRFRCASFLMEEGRAVSLHSGRRGCLLARTEKPTWSIIPGISPGTS
jgi:hypothetical protein